MANVFQNFLEARTGREKLLLGVGALVVFAWLGLTYVAEPLVNGSHRTDAELIEKRSLLQWMAENAERMVEVRRGGLLHQAASASEIQESLTRRDLDRYLTLIEPKPDGVVVIFNNADFRASVGWLLDVGSELGYRVENASFVKRDVAGFADVEALLVPLAK